jgi:hypothetical protein
MDDKEREDAQWWDCICGARVRLSDDIIESGQQFCPTCGAPVGDPSIITSADTQMVNIQDMARIAQEGIEVSVSGEWDTAENATLTKRSRSKE